MLSLLMLTLNICSSSRTTSSLVHFSFVILTTFRTVPTSETNVPHVKPSDMFQQVCPTLFPALQIKLIHEGCCFPTTSIPTAPTAESSLHAVHLWFHCMAEPTQSQAAPGRDGPALLLHKHTNTDQHVHAASYKFLHISLSQNWGPSDPKENWLRGLNWQKIISSFLQNSFVSNVDP